MRVNNKAIGDKQNEALELVKTNAEVYNLTKEERQAFKDAVEVVYDAYLNEGLITQDELDNMRPIVANN